MKIGCKRESNVRKEFFSGMQSALVENREVSYFQSAIKFYEFHFISNVCNVVKQVYLHLH